ncbi:MULTISPECIES: hydroxymethylglutaryl-CoA lyase [Aminobacterium]|jgi:hydroxymethylglutaryl-CoA lyase|uniref:Pyruvate carboxyltransferase n=1 Tax=Aminobacterium colombiense (strain DSM 12261 / ALA-1) TaxID=572547 RepID=D5EFW0_AMICL|nr:MULTISPECIES: hydroxymethylglutaryl-CoA lyase [Aminobacterium]MDD2379342.1 hydroxymethylglutaryl-CoA lyase [Aminobacterium colombiense]ADE57442.1 pyruvate carboxyltransferase [Aminobacterium colombiense DSM 12261]MDD3768043.1 hydroxymethylglutaryl-CoA lyase [Aminobacterium colombiense]MDD4266065.1 hydroxymethylglutaryl-CoA lyase [Aminobacterium colombiense]NLK30719.1 hydroxymethylglutaryl-CoA lyase [Aminobacterium colombiense]
MMDKQIPHSATIREVCPRDGFQSVRDFIPTEDKVKFINTLVETGISIMEVTSFVSPKAIPQMADAADVMEEFNKRWKDKVDSVVLIPNLRGAENALKVNPDWINFVLSASESHNKANTKRTVAESLEELKRVAAIKGETKLCVSVATAFECPFEGAVDPDNVIRVLDAIFEIGVHGITLADTIGTANPFEVTTTLSKIRGKYGNYPFFLHLHDTHGMALVNTLAALHLGFNCFDSAAGGLGGCPFAPGAAGNVATEDLVNFLEKIGVHTNVDLLKVISAARNMKAYGLKIMSHLSASSVGKESDSCRQL